MVRLWRNRDRMDTVISLAEALEPGDLRTVLITLLAHYYPPSTRGKSG